jgi:TonB-linked SusC/RagA family outer membrane protein
MIRIYFFVVAFAVSQTLFAGDEVLRWPIGNKMSNNDPASITVSGTVVSETGEPMPGVNVILKGTAIGTSTDSNGKYVIEASVEDAVLVFSFIGYSSQEVIVNSRTIIDVTLEVDVETLSEVVVVGYGEQKKESLTAAIGKIDNKDIQTTVNTSLAQKIQGKIAGLQIRQNSGQPGDFNNSIVIRGFTNQDGLGGPLYVIDGILRNDPGEFQRINPVDIESISVLKDASAAIYGFGAANGVILVTTKKGRGKPTFNYSFLAGTVRPTNMPRMANASEYVQMYNDAMLFRPGGIPYLPKEEIQKYIDGAPGYETTDWYGLTMKKYSTQMQHNFSANGGNDNTNYFVSFGYVDEGGLLRSNDMGYKRYNLRTNLTTKLHRNLEAQILLAGRYDKKWEPGENFFNIFKGTRVTLPTEKAYANNNPLYPAPVLSTQNPLVLAERDITGYNENYTRNFQSSFALTYTAPFLKGLSLKSVVSYDANNYQAKSVYKPYSLYRYDESLENPYVRVPQRVGTGNINNNNTNNNQLILQGFMMYQNRFAKKHNVNATVVVEQNQNNYRESSLKRYYQSFYTKDQVRFADRARMENDGIEGMGAALSYIGRFNYDFKEKYLAEFSFRYMGHFGYAPSNRWGFMPVASAGWRISEEKFMQMLPIISNLKLRGSYGRVGQPAGNNFQFVEGYLIGSGGSYEFENGKLTSGVAAPIPVNDKLTWMTAEQADIGIDVGLWDNRLTFEADYYSRLLSGIPTRRNVSLPNTFGSELPEENLNSQVTRGIEFTLAYKGSAGNFTYGASGNFNFARTKDKHVENSGFTNSWDKYRNGRENRWRDIEWGYTYTGQFQTEQQLMNAPMQNGEQGNIVKEFPGDFMYADINHDGMIDGNDEAPIFYNSVPKMHYGLTLNAGWKNFDVNILFQGSAMYTLYFSEVYAELFAFRGNTPAYFYDRWHKADPYDPDSEWVPGKWPASRTVETVGRMYAESSVWRRDASYVRLKSVELGYRISIDRLKTIGIQSVRVYINGFNLYTFADRFVKPFDPEKLEGLGNQFDPNFNRAGFTYPVTKTYNFGVNVSF